MAVGIEIILFERIVMEASDAMSLQSLTSSVNEKEARKARTIPTSAIQNQSVIRAFAILRSFHSPGDWVAACDLSRRSHIHEATVSRFMHSLMEVGAVVRNQDGHYRCVLFVMPGTQINDLEAPLRKSPPYAHQPGHS